MKARAAVAFAPKTPLEIVELDLEGPRAGEVLVEIMATGICHTCHRGWGTSIVIGVAEAGREIATRPFQLVTGRNWRGTAFGGAKGRTDVPKIVDWYMDGKMQIDPMITPVLSLDEINKGLDLMHAGESIRSVVVF